jgi:ribonuclease HI
MFRAEWLETLNKTKVVGITWIYCSGHAGVHGNEEADRLVDSVTRGMLLGLCGIRNGGSRKTPRLCILIE